MFNKIIDSLLNLDYILLENMTDESGKTIGYKYLKDNNHVSIFLENTFTIKNTVLTSDDDIYFFNSYTYNEYYNILNIECRIHKLKKLKSIINY